MHSTPLHSVSVAGATFDGTGRVLLVQRKDNGEWQAPGGVLEHGETFEEGVAREVLEETGVIVEVECLTGVYKNMVRAVVALVYRCRAVGGCPTPSEETSKVDWLTLAEATAQMTPAFLARVQDAAPSERFHAASRAHDGVHLFEGNEDLGFVKPHELG